MNGRYKRHVFVCTNRREDGNPKGCCASKGAQELRDAMKKRAAALGLHDVVRVNNAGCLDACEDGIALVIYPEQIWYRAVTVSDIEDILTSHVVNGEVVERLLFEGDDSPRTQKAIEKIF